MGGASNKNNELLKRYSVKLQAQQIPTFAGESIKWHIWKKEDESRYMNRRNAPSPREPNLRK